MQLEFVFAARFNNLHLVQRGNGSQNCGTKVIKNGDVSAMIDWYWAGYNNILWPVNKHASKRTRIPHQSASHFPWFCSSAVSQVSRKVFNQIATTIRRWSNFLRLYWNSEKTRFAFYWLILNRRRIFTNIHFILWDSLSKTIMHS